MAGDWIKMRVDLSDDPAVIKIAAALGMSQDEVVGKLHRVWSWADKHASDGVAEITPAWVDTYVAKEGFAFALVEVDWLIIGPDRIEFPNFDRHNGKSAKRRVEAAIRQQKSREKRDKSVTTQIGEAPSCPIVLQVMQRDKYTCVYCGTSSTARSETSDKSVMSVGTIIPLREGGQEDLDNLVCCCKLCKSKKADRTPEDWGVLPKFLQPNVTYMSQRIYDNRVTKAQPEKRREENINTPPLPPSMPEPIAKLSKPLIPILGEEVLLELGIRETKAVLAKLEAHGCAQADFDGIIAHYRENFPAWGEGALVERLAALRPGQKPDELWPTPKKGVPTAKEKKLAANKSAKVAAAARAAEDEKRALIAAKLELENRFGPIVDSFDPVMQRQWICEHRSEAERSILTRLVKGKPSGLVREALIEICRTRADTPAGPS